jgi:hypothetical protein
MKNVGLCAHCGCEVWLPDALHKAAAEGAPNISFYCGYGHVMAFSKGETEETKLRRERDRLAQRIAEKDDEIKHQLRLLNAAERRVTAARGQVTKIKNRVGRGVCPCCNRTFENLHRHVSSQHPTFTSEAAE